MKRIEKKINESNQDYLRLLKRKLEKKGIMVMSDTKVASSRNRKLSVKEFRGFALSDKNASLIFINGNDSKSAQIFTLAHELAHIYLGYNSIGNTALNSISNSKRIEAWCNKVAAEFLIPLESLKERVKPNQDIIQQVPNIVKDCKVSKLVILRRLFDGKYINKSVFEEEFKKQINIEIDVEKKSSKNSKGGPSFYTIKKANVGDLFIKSLAVSTLERKTLFTEASRLLEIKGTRIFQKLVKDIGVK